MGPEASPSLPSFLLTKTAISDCAAHERCAEGEGSIAAGFVGR